MGEKFAWPLQISACTAVVVLAGVLLSLTAAKHAALGGSFGVLLAYMQHRARRRGVTQTAVAFARTGLLEGKAATVIHDSGKVTLCVVDPDADPDDEDSGYMTDSEGY